MSCAGVRHPAIMLEPEAQAAALLRCANHLDGVREELLLCERQLQQEMGLTLWVGRARREYDAAALEVQAVADRLRYELLLLATDQRSQASAVVLGSFE